MSRKREDDDGFESPSAESQAPALFSCPEEGCVRVYMRYKNLENHLACGNHKRISDKETFHDKAKILYGERVSSDVRPVPSLNASVTDVPVDEIHTKGWALAKKRAEVRFSAKQKDYLNRRFNEGETTSAKVDANDVSKQMRYAKDNEGRRMFTFSEFLSPQQIGNYFSRLSSKVRGTADVTDDENQACRGAKEKEDLQSEIMTLVGLKHPIVSNSYNLCELARNNKLKDLSLSVLKKLCISLDVTVMSDKRRKTAYTEQVQKLVESCSCFE